MTNVSLARIMYGTNEDLHALSPMRRTSLPSLAPQSGFENSGNDTATEQDPLQGLLHKAWFLLSRKN